MDTGIAIGVIVLAMFSGAWAQDAEPRSRHNDRYA